MKTGSGESSGIDESTYRALFNSVNDAVAVHYFDSKGNPSNFITVNDVICKKYGYSREELLKMSPAQIDEPEAFKTYAIPAIRKLAKEGKVTFETIHLTKTGKKIPVEINATIFYVNGKKAMLAVARDITERKKTEEELKESEEKFRTFFNSIPVPTYTWQKKGDDLVLVDYNNVASAVIRGATKKLIGIKLTSMYKDTYQQNRQIKIDMKRCLREKKVIEKDMEYRLQTSHENKFLHVKYAYVPPNFVMVHTEDITKRKKAEETLKESEDKYKLLVDKMEEITVILNKTGKILFANKFTQNILGYTEKELIGKSVFSLLTKNSIKRAMYNLTQEFLGRLTGSMEVEITTKKGEIRIIALSEASNPIYKDKKITSLLVNGIDITEQRKAEELNKSIIKCTTDWVWEVDLQGKYTYCSENVKQILGYTAKEILGKTPFDFMTKEEAKRIGLIFEDISKKQKPIADLENWNIHKNGSKVCLLTNGFPIFCDSGKLIGYRGADKDITERKKAEEELLKSKNILQDKIKDLETFHNIAIGRELRMIELKEKIKELEEKLGKK